MNITRLLNRPWCYRPRASSSANFDPISNACSPRPAEVGADLGMAGKQAGGLGDFEQVDDCIFADLSARPVWLRCCLRRPRCGQACAPATGANSLRIALCQPTGHVPMRIAASSQALWGACLRRLAITQQQHDAALSRRLQKQEHITGDVRLQRMACERAGGDRATGPQCGLDVVDVALGSGP